MTYQQPQQFLREPALFPARISGETWGSERFDVELAGEVFRIDGLSSQQRQLRLPPLKAAAAAAALHITVFRAPASDFVPIDTRGWEYWVDVRWSEHGFTLSGMNVMARVELDRAAIWTSVEEPEEFSGVVENVLRPLVAARLLANGGLLVHSAAVDGYLFAGRSGAGKSTIARLALDAARPVLSDDLNAIVREDGGFMLEPLPFTGDLDARDISNQRTQLRAVLALDKGEAERVSPMSLADTVSLLVRCAPYVNQDPLRLPLLLDRASEIAHGTLRGAITFRRDGNVWPILDAGLAPS